MSIGGEPKFNLEELGDSSKSQTESESKPHSFSQEYRIELAQRLLEEKDTFTRRQILEDTQSTFSYELARAETIARRKELDLRPIYQAEQLVTERTSEDKDFSTLASNEQHLYKLFDAIREQRGAVVGVGVEQVLDIFCNSKVDRAYIVDITSSNTLLIHTLLEIGIRHKKLFGKFPTNTEFIKYFQNLDVLRRLLPEIIGKDQTQLIIEKLEQGEHTPHGKVYLHDLLDLKSEAINDEGKHYGWVAEENLAKVLSAYESGRIDMITMNLLDPNAVEKLAEKIADTHVPVSILYTSNVEDHLGREQVSDLARNLKLLPLADEVVILRTFTSLSREVEPEISGERDSKERRKLKSTFLPWHYVAEKIHPRNPENRVGKGIKTIRNWAKLLTSRGVTFLGFKKEELE